jgi:transcriptional regulator with XRE-family HTH domain
MDMTAFGARLKALRTGKGLSQEEAARRLGVSPQSVSKWENGRNSPELSVILPLARLLGVSAEELLENPTQRRELWEKRWKAAFAEGKHAEALAAAEEALAAMPEDREFRFRQANGEYQTAALAEDAAERLRLLRAAEKHFAALLRDCPDFEEAGVMLACTLLAQGKRKEAEALAGKLPYGEKLELLLRQGKGRLKALRREIAKAAAELLNLLQTEGSEEACRLTEALIAASGQPERLIWYSLNLHLRRARRAAEAGERAKARAALEKLADLARDYAPSATESADALLAGLPEPPSPAEVRRWVRDALAEEAFAALRTHPGFPVLEE